MADYELLLGLAGEREPVMALHLARSTGKARAFTATTTALWRLMRLGYAEQVGHMPRHGNKGAPKALYRITDSGLRALAERVDWHHEQGVRIRSVLHRRAGAYQDAAA